MANPVLFLAQLNGSLAFQDRAGGGTLTGSGAVRYAPASGARTNWWRNPLLLGSNDWGANGASGTITLITDDGVTGPNSVEISANTGGHGGNGSGNLNLVVAPTQPLTISFAAKLVSGSTDWSIVPSMRGAASGFLSEGVSQAFTPTTSWQRFSVTFTPSSSAAGVHRINLKILRVGSTASTIRVTDILMEQASSAGAFFDPRSGVWLDVLTGTLGTAHASPSVSQAVAWVEEGTTNLCTNPSFETNTTGWSNVGTSTWSRVTTYAWLGSASARAVFDGATTYPAVNAGTTSGFSTGATPQTGTVSAYLRGSGTVYLVARWFEDGYAATTDAVSSAITLTDQWVRYSVSATSTPTTGNDSFNIYVTGNWAGGTSTADVYIDGVQIEIKAYATSYTDGSLGTGYAWSGTAHASSSTRTATSVTVAKETRMSNVRGSGAAIFQRAYDSAVSQYLFGAGAQNTVSEDWIGLRIGQGSPDALICSVSHSNTGIVNGTASGSASALLTRIFGYGQWEAASVGAAVSTDAVVTAVVANPPVGWTAVIPLSIGSNANTLHLNGYIGPVLIADRPLTAKERATLNANGIWTFRMLAKRDMLLLRR